MQAEGHTILATHSAFCSLKHSQARGRKKWNRRRQEAFVIIWNC